MAEYNFWDDRTAEDNDDNYCPILDDYCYDMSKCEECVTYAKFVRCAKQSEIRSYQE